MIVKPTSIGDRIEHQHVLDAGDPGHRAYSSTEIRLPSRVPTERIEVAQQPGELIRAPAVRS